MNEQDKRLIKEAQTLCAQELTDDDHRSLAVAFAAELRTSCRKLLDIIAQQDARIEALERVLLSGYVEDSICYACVHQYEPNNKGRCYSAPIKDDGRGICTNFQFDEARFRKGGERE